MKRRSHKRPALLTIALLLLGLGLSCVWWVRKEQQQVALNRQLIAAIKSNDTQTVVETLRQGASARAPDLPDTPLSFWELAKRVLRHRTSQLKEGTPALALTFNMRGSGMQPCLNTNPQIISALLDYGADVNTRQFDGIQSNTHKQIYIGSLISVAELCHNDAVFEMALKHGADPNSRPWDDGDNTLLIHAASEGNIQHARMLLHSGADVNARGSIMNETALIATTIRNPPHQREMLTLLLDAGADINATMDSGSALTVLADSTYSPDILPSVRLLLQRGADVNVRDDRKRTALFFAVGRDNIAVVRELLSHGADVNATDRDGVTPYCITGEEGPMRKLLRKAGTKPKRKRLPPAYWS